MRYKIAFVFLFFVLNHFTANAQADSTSKNKGDVVLIEVNFPDGDTTWKTYLQKVLNAATPANNGAPKGSYTVVAQFVVDKEGNPSDVRAMTNHGYGMEEEVIRALKKGPKWYPAGQDSRTVKKGYGNVKVTFVVTDKRKKKKKKKKDQ